MSRFEKWSVWITTLLTTVTGLVYMWMKYFIEPTDAWSVVNHPWQPLVLKLHIVVAPFMVFALGMVTVGHVWRHYRNGLRPGRRSGIVTALAALPMIVSGYLIQAITHMGLLRAMVVAHIGVGILYVVGLGVHQLMVQRGAEEEAGAYRVSSVRTPAGTAGEMIAGERPED
ncbi:MAG: hypothetical protein ACE5PT_04215 [Gemmatimonadales bacterium]